MVHQAQQRKRAKQAHEQGKQQDRLSADSIRQPARREQDGDEHRHAHAVDLQRMRRRDAVGELQPAHDVEEHEVEADGAEDRQPGEPQEQRAMVVHRFGQGRLRRLLLDRSYRQASA